MAEGSVPVANDILWEDEVECRQFSCEKCKKSWWHEVLARKRVSRCKRCRQKYDALARDKEFGVGIHECDCGNTFSGRTSYGVTSPCYKCGAQVLPKIIPNRDGIKKRTNRKHNCKECGGKGPCKNKNPVVHASSEHESTGSTISSICTEDNDSSTIVDPQETERRRREYNRALRDLDDDLRLLSVDND